MVNSIQLQGLTYMRSLQETASANTVDGENFDSILEEEINAADNTEETNSVTYTNPEDLVTVDSPSSLEVYFQEASDTYGVPAALIKAVAKAESNFNSQAISSAGAQGVMQLMPSTAQGLGVTDPFDARENILGGTKYLAQMLTKYSGSVKLALAAYNAGSGNVDKYEGIPPFTETQNYVKKIFGYLGMDTVSHKTESTEKVEASGDTTTQSTQSTAVSGLSSEDISKLADAIISGAASAEDTSSTASELYSQLYGASNSNSNSSTLGNYSSLINSLFTS